MKKEFSLKIRRIGEKRFRFLMANGNTTTLKIHATRFDSFADAEAWWNGVAKDNDVSDLEYKIQPI